MAIHEYHCAAHHSGCCSCLDPNYEWIEVVYLDKPGSEYIKGPCRHKHIEHVFSDGQLVSRLCLSCDTQLPGDGVYA